MEMEKASPKYSTLSESLRKTTPPSFQCSVFCGGRQCKYENPTRLEKHTMTLRGLYSSWVTEDILATARPSSVVMQEFGIIDQFKRNNIRSMINLQHAGEHRSCGFGLLPCGFSYDPSEFMTEGVTFYNFPWNDYGVRSSLALLDMVKVLDFALSEGKVAIHCHAGLGRTGVLIACYLVYSRCMPAHQAISLVRQKRPCSVQTRGQIACVEEFSVFIKPSFEVFPLRPTPLSKILLLQNRLLHGEELRKLRFIPKVFYFICLQLVKLSAGNVSDLETFVANLSRREPTRLLKCNNSQLATPSSTLLLISGTSPLGKSLSSKSLPSSDTDDDLEVIHVDHQVTCLTTQSDEESLHAPAATQCFIEPDQRPYMQVLGDADKTMDSTELKSIQENINSSTNPGDHVKRIEDFLIGATLLWAWLNQVEDLKINPRQLRLIVSMDTNQSYSVYRFGSAVRSKLSILLLLLETLRLMEPSPTLQRTKVVNNVLRRFLPDSSETDLDFIFIAKECRKWMSHLF